MERILAQLGVPEKQQPDAGAAAYGTGSMCAAYHDYDAMTNIAKDLRVRPGRCLFSIARPQIVAEQISQDGTAKWLMRFPARDATEQPVDVETVYIPRKLTGAPCACRARSAAR
jgi:23S rRNA (adenine2503-C2)-methyltransferase